eukprot:4762951-Heterocapsa_arctica.AAC.1
MSYDVMSCQRSGTRGVVPHSFLALPPKLDAQNTHRKLCHPGAHLSLRLYQSLCGEYVGEKFKRCLQGPVKSGYISHLCIV